MASLALPQHDRLPGDRAGVAATTSKAPPLYTWWSGQQLVPLVKAGALANLTPYVKTWEAKYGLNPDVENAYKVNGQYYGAPEETADWVMFYNKKDFAKYNMGVPTTWAQLMSDAATFKKNGITPFTYYVDDWAGFIWFEQILVEQDPSRLSGARTGQNLLYQRARGRRHERMEDPR